MIRVEGADPAGALAIDWREAQRLAGFRELLRILDNINAQLSAGAIQIAPETLGALVEGAEEIHLRA